MLRLCGAELIEVPAVPFKDPNNYVHQAERKAQEMATSEPNGVLYANQWDNTSNHMGHYRSSGPGNLGNKRMVKSMVLPVPSAPAARWPELACS